MPHPAVSSATFRTEVAVIGAGVIGLAIARALSQAGKEVLIMDRAPTICSETSSRNSEVIHAGLYYPTDSRKAKFCVRGKNQLYDYCASRNIPHLNCGKLIVATDSESTAKLRTMRDQAIRNGVDDVRILSSEDVKYLEPQIVCDRALLSPSTGVIDSHSFFLSLLADAEEAGATLALHTDVSDATIEEDGIYIHAGGAWIQCENVVNASGLWAHRVASLIHRATTWKPPKQYFARGTYFRLTQKPSFQRLIYPIPASGGLGVHATVDYAMSSVKFGPDVEWLEQASEPDQIDLNPDHMRGEAFYDEIRKYWPSLPDDKLVPDYCGIRPKLYHPAKTGGRHEFVDFAMFDYRDHGVQGLIHLLGIESPGLTSGMAIAEHVSSKLTKGKS